MEERNEQQALLESVRAALEGCDEQEREAFGHELAALAEGFAGAAEWEAEQLARSEARAQMEQRLAEYQQQVGALRLQAQELEQMKRAAAAAFFVQAGAVDGEYLAERLGEQIRFQDGEIGEPAALIKAAREQYPALFKKELVGVRPAEVKEIHEPVRELSFLERARLYEQRPMDYRRAFGR